MADLPKSIRVGYRDYTIEDWPVHKSSGEGKIGSCDRDNAVIKICTAYGPAQSAECLLHEVFHAAYYMGVLDPGDNEERTVSVLGNIMTQVWRDNPEFVAFMSESLT